MYTNAFEVRGLTPLLNTDKPTDAEIRAFIKRAESVINQHLAKRYQTPIEKNIKLLGTISTQKADTDLDPIESPYNIIVGNGTSFLTELKAMDTIFVCDTGEALKVLEIIDNEELITTSNACINSSNSEFFVIPDSIVTASEYLTAQLILITHFSEKAYNQDTERFNKQFELIARELITLIKSGNFIDNSLVLQSDSNTTSGLIYVGIDNDVRNFVDNNLTIAQSLDFLK